MSTFKINLKAIQDRLTRLRKSNARTIVVTNGSHVVTYVDDGVPQEYDKKKSKL